MAEHASPLTPSVDDLLQRRLASELQRSARQHEIRRTYAQAQAPEMAVLPDFNMQGEPIRPGGPGASLPTTSGDILEQLYEGFTLNNSMGAPLHLISDINGIALRHRGREVEGYDPVQDPELEQYMPYMEFFLASNSPEESQAVRERLDRYLERQANLSGPFAAVSTVIGSILDPTYLAAEGVPALIRLSSKMNAIGRARGGLGPGAEIGLINPETLRPGQIAAAAIADRINQPSPRASALYWGLASGALEGPVTANIPGAEGDLLAAIGGGALFGAGSAAFRAGSQFLRGRGADEMMQRYAEGIRRYEEQYGTTRGVDPALDDLARSWGRSTALTPFVRPDSSVSARGVGTAPTQRQLLEGEALVSALGLERHPFSPITRVLKSGSLAARDLVTELLEIPFLQNKNLQGTATTRPVWREVAYWRGRAADTAAETRQLYKGYLHRMKQERANDILTRAQFEREVFFARINGNSHMVPEVAEASRAWGDNVFDPLGREANESGVFTRPHQMQVEYLMSKRDAGPNRDGVYPVVIDGDEFLLTPDELSARISDLERIIERIEAQGGLRANYVPIILRKDVFLRNKEDAVRRLQGVFRMSQEEALETYSRIVAHDPFVPFGPDTTGMASSIRSRDLFWSDDQLREFMRDAGDVYFETDVGKLAFHYSRQMASDVGLFNRFGSIEMVDQINAIRTDYEDLISSASRLEKRRLRAERDRVINDVRAMRDLVRGTYGLPNDPNKGFSVFARNIKRLNALSMLTGALAALPDPGRIVMRDGFERAFGTIFSSFDGEMGRVIRRISKEDLNLAAQGFEMTTGERAALMADVGDVVGVGGGLERGLEKLNNFTFTYVNGMNAWTDIMKQWAGMVIQTRMIDHIMGVADGTADGAAIARLASAYIDGPMAQRMAEQLRQHGQSHKNLRAANLSQWTDEEAAHVFADGLGRDVDIVIVTPGQGDTPLFMSTELGGLVFQFKKFSMASFQRVGVAGLQEPNGRFVIGALMMVGLGMMIARIRAEQTGGQSWENRSLSSKLADSIDRSGILGIFGDAIRVGEALTDPHYSDQRLVGQILGPTGSQITNFTDALYQLSDGNIGNRDMEAIRRVMPWGNIAHLHGVNSAIYSAEDNVR